jgi:hypothetical protein
MKKIKSLFQRNYDGDRQVRDEVVPGSEWVIAGDGIATRKWDGMAVMRRNGEWYKRYDAKAGRTPPPGFEPAEPAPDAETGHWPGWVKMEQGKELLRVLAASTSHEEDGTYEFCGPTIGTRHGANPEGLAEHILVRHGTDVLDAPRTFAELKNWLADKQIEGIVWHHPDGRMVKIKRSDFGYKP